MNIIEKINEHSDNISIILFIAFCCGIIVLSSIK